MHRRAEVLSVQRVSVSGQGYQSGSMLGWHARIRMRQGGVLAVLR